MIEKERSPALRRRSSSPRHVLGDGGLADIDAELEEFSMDAWSAPERIGKTDLPDQPPNFWRDAWPAGTPTRFPAPKERKPARCHRTTVSGSTIVRASRIRGAIRYRQTKIIRSKLLKTGRRGDVRRSTFS